jgi:hypothetical protein
VGDDDRLPYFTANATGPQGGDINFTTLVPTLNGTLLHIENGGCAVDCAKATVDRNDSGANQRLTSTASVAFPAVSMMKFAAGSPGGYSGMVKIGAVSANASASSGPGAGAPAVSGTPVNVQMWDNATGGYKTVNVTPGAAPPAVDPTAQASFTVLGLYPVVMDATLHWNKGVTSQTSSGGAVTDASASLTNWLFVELHVVIKGALGVGVLADLNLHIDYGRIASTAGYQPVT